MMTTGFIPRAVWGLKITHSWGDAEVQVNTIVLPLFGISVSAIQLIFLSTLRDFLDAGYSMHYNTKVGKSQESALLESRTLYPKRSLQCLQFFYKMTGSLKDRLVIWVKMDDGTGTVRRMKKIQTFLGRLYLLDVPRASRFVLYSTILHRNTMHCRGHF